MLKTGKLQVLDWSIHYPFAQILWGTVFCLPLGFSFSLLRLSTIVLGWLGALALYGTVREFGRTQAESLFATLVLIVNPVIFLLSFSFMTDVPFVSLSNISFFFITRGLCRRDSFQVWRGCTFAVCAVFIRQIAIAIPAAVLLYVLFARSYRSWRYIVPPVTASLFLCLIPFLIGQAFGLTSQYAGRTWIFDYWLRHYDQAVPGLLRVLMHTGLALIPISVAAIPSVFRRRLFWGTIVALFLLTGCSVLFSSGIPQPLQETWQISIFGKERLFHGVPAHNLLPSWLNFPYLYLLFSRSEYFVLVVNRCVRHRSKHSLIGARACSFS